MRIRIFRAFASNNSGSYTIVGSFRSAETAEEVAAALRAICAEHDAWAEKNPWSDEGESPLDAFARAHGLTEEKPGRADAWPEHGDPPTVMALGAQVIVHAPYTVTMPRLFGEYLYKKGGRVDVELNHAHEEIAVEFSFYVPKARWDDEDAKATIEAVEKELEELLPICVARPEHDRRPVVLPVFHRGFWGSRHLSCVFPDLVEGVEAVRASAAARGVAVHVKLRECEGGVPDPLAPLRASDRPWGRARVIVWSIGDDRIRAMKAVREVTAKGLDEAKRAIADLPAEVLVDVDAAYATKAVEVLRAAGCDAEAVFPAK